MIPKQYGNEYRMTLLCVDSYSDSVMEGRYYNSCRKGGVKYQSMMELVLSIEEMLDQMQFPQAFYRTRSFAGSNVGSYESPDENWTQKGNLATFQLRILFRQNVSWQGTIRWVDGRKEESFRSVLEFMILIDSALKESKRKLENE